MEMNTQPFTSQDVYHPDQNRLSSSCFHSIKAIPFRFFLHLSLIIPQYFTQLTFFELNPHLKTLPLSFIRFFEGSIVL